MILSLTATAGTHFYGRVAADTSVIPVKKTQITEKPLAERLEPKSADYSAKKKTVGTEKMAAGATTKSTAKPAVVSVDKNAGKAKEKSTVTTKPVSEATNNSWEAAMRDEKSGKVKASSGEKSTGKTKPVVETKSTGNSKIVGGDRVPLNNKNKSAGKTTITGKEKAAVKIAPEKITTTAVTNKSTEKAGTTSKTTVAAKKTSGVAGKKLAAATPAEINRAAITRSLSSSKTKNARKLRKGIGIELYQPLAFKYAILLDVPVEKVTDDKLLEVLDRWYGIRYRFGGESRKGIDCSAFTQTFISSYFDYQLPRRAEEQYAACKKIKKKKLRQGDLVFFKTHGPDGGISHVGVYLINNRFVHSSSSKGVRISNLDDDYYKEKYAGGGRIK